MAGENKQSVQIQTLDGYPFTGVGGGSQTGRLTGGQNAAADLQQIEGSVTPVTAATQGSYYQMARVPSNAIIKSVELTQIGGTVTTFTVDVTIGISDSTIDGTQPGLQVVPSGLTTPAANAFIANPSLTTTGLSAAAALFATASTVISTANAKVWTDVTLASGNFTLTGMEQPLWQAAGFTQDPGGFLDIALLSTAASNFSGTMVVGARVRFIVPPG